VGEGTNAPRAEAVAEVLATREALAEELVRLEASFRAAIDVPAKVKRNPGKAAGLAAGAGFIAVGGPRRLFRRAKRVVMGPEAPLPKSMLPKEIEESLKRLGTDGERVQGLLDREFAAYLRANGPERQRRELSRTAAVLMVAAARPFVLNYSKRLANQVFATDTKSYAERLEQVRDRVAASVPPKPSDPTG
jgi:hypothetical protein